MLSASDWGAIGLTLQLAGLTTAILIVLATPLAWWLARTRSRARSAVAALVAMPIVLPPTVIGFYLLVALGPNGPLGRLTQTAGLGLLPFTFAGLVLASVIYSLPFVVQPIAQAFGQIDDDLLETAATLRAGPLDRFLHIALPMARPGYLVAAVMGFAHTVGEFGVVLMIGGNIPDRTRVVSLQIYEHVEALEYGQAHLLSALMVGFSFIVLFALYLADPARRRG